LRQIPITRISDGNALASGLDVTALRLGPLWNFTYIVGCEETRQAILIDPAWDVPATMNAVRRQSLDVRWVIVTHSHSDHVNGLADMVRATGARVVAHEAEATGLRAHFEGPFLEVARDEAFEFGRHNASLLHTPGHTPGSLSIEVAGHLFTGDTLNVGSPGTPGPGAAAIEQLWTSTRGIVAALSDDTVIHPGHDAGPAPAATLAEERLRNPAFLARDLGDFTAAIERATGRRHRD
jgi:glyoxylase-like metal-dependent hydrolase (beta-lactamase superfamily II)